MYKRIQQNLFIFLILVFNIICKDVDLIGWICDKKKLWEKKCGEIWSSIFFKNICDIFKILMYKWVE